MPPHQTPSADESSEHKHFNHGADRNVNGHDYASFMETGDNGLVPGLSPKRRATVSQVYDPSFFKIANPGPLGLFSFALTTFVLGFYQCGVGLPNSDPFGSVGPEQAVFGLAVFLGGGAQFIAGLMEFRVGNTFGTTVHCCYGAFWLAFSMFMVPSLGLKDAYAGNERAYSVALGIFLIAWCFLTILFFIAALRTNIAILSVLGCLAIAFLLLSVAQFTLTLNRSSAVAVNKAGGAFAILTALLSFYAGGAGIMRAETTWVRFPLGEIAVHEPKGKEAKQG